MKQWKKLLTLSASVLAIAGSAIGVNAEALEPVEKSVVYLTTITPEQAGYKAMEALVAAYQEEVNPGFTMDIQYVADKPSYLQKVKTYAASDELPDMFNVDADAYTNILLENGLIQDITPVIEENGLDEIFLAAPLAWGRTSDGVQIAIPIDYSIEVFWYNKAIFEDAGIEIPKTFDEFLDICEQYGCIPQLDTKNLNSFDSVKELYQILEERGIQNEVIMTSFNNLYLQLLREMNPNITLTYGIESAQTTDIEWLKNYNVGVSVNSSNLVNGDEKAYVDSDIMVNIYSVKDKTSLGILMDRGITSFTVDNVMWDQ